MENAEKMILVIVLALAIMGYMGPVIAAIGWNQKSKDVKAQKILYVVYGCMFPVYAGAQEGSFSAVFLFVALCMWIMAVATFYADHRRKKREKFVCEEE